MKAAIVVLNQEGGVVRIIGPFANGHAAADHSATLEWGVLRMVLLLEDPTAKTCTYTFSHTREWCGNPGCREA